MHDSNPFRLQADLLNEAVLLEERLNFAHDICEAVGLEPEELLEMMLDLVEAVEQLDELSPKTLASYIGKAHMNAIDHANKSHAALSAGIGSIPYEAWSWKTRKERKPDLTDEQNKLVNDYNKGHHKAYYRSVGIRLAADKLQRAVPRNEKK